MPIDDVKLMHYVDGALSEEERRSIKSQIAQDPQLQKKVKILELTTREKLKDEMGEMSSEFAPEVENKLQSIEASQSTTTESLKQKFIFFTFPKFAAFAAACVLAGTVTVRALESPIDALESDKFAKQFINAINTEDGVGDFKYGLFRKGKLELGPDINLRNESNEKCRTAVLHIKDASQISFKACKIDGEWEVTSDSIVKK